MAARNIVNIMVFNQRLVYTNRLWEPETKDMNGQPMETPQYSATVIVPKTGPNWAQEPSLASLAQAVQQVYQQQMAPTGIQMQYVEWGVKDGDRPNTKGKTPEWGKGHWVIRAGTGYAPTVSGVIDGREVEMPSQSLGGRKIYGDGDFAALALGVTVGATNPSRIKLYLGTVLFTGKGEPISIGGGVSASEMMAAAKAQGVNVQGIAGAAAAGAGGPGFGGSPSFQQPPHNNGGGGFQPGGPGPGFAAGPQGGAPAGGPTFQPPGGGFNPSRLGDDIPF